MIRVSIDCPVWSAAIYESVEGSLAPLDRWIDWMFRDLHLLEIDQPSFDVGSIAESYRIIKGHVVDLEPLVSEFETYQEVTGCKEPITVKS